MNIAKLKQSRKLTYEQMTADTGFSRSKLQDHVRGIREPSRGDVLVYRQAYLIKKDETK